MKKSLILFLLFSLSTAYAQKKPLDHSVYDSWQSLGLKLFSYDGHWISYSINPQEGDGTLIFSNLMTNTKITAPRGTAVKFSADSRFAAYRIKPMFKETRLEKIKKKKPEEMTKDSLGIVSLGSVTIQKIARLKSFDLPEEGLSLIAYQLEKQTDTSKNKVSKTESEKDGSDLILKNLITGVERLFKFVDTYKFSKDGKLLIFSSTGSARDKTVAPGVFLLNTESGSIKTLIKGKGSFKGYIFDDDNEYLAFLGEQSPDKQVVKAYNIYYNSLSLDTAQILVDKDIPGMPAGWSIHGDSKLTFTKEGNRLFFGIAPARKPKDTALVEFEHAKLDIWSYKDDYLQPMQLVNLEKEAKRSFLTTIDIFSSDPKVVPLADLQLPNASLINEGNSNYVLVATDYGNRSQIQWSGESIWDYYLVDVRNGSRKRIIQNLTGVATASPAGSYVIYFDKSTSNWYTYQVATGKVTHLNVDIPVKFADEENDMPAYPSAYGLAGWSEDDKSVFIYDRYDVWEFNPEGKGKPKTLTNGIGRENNITFRIEKTDPDFRFFNKKDKLWLSAFNNVTKENGFYSKQLNDSKNPELEVMAKMKFSNVIKAKNADRLAYDKSNYQLSPDIYVTTDFKTEVKLTSTNQQQKNYNWGTAELISWTTTNGHKSDGILYKPEDFDPAKKYPMIVYFYEKLSDGLYAYQAPAPTPSRLNIPYFVSNGYLVFAPDINYEKGYPGRSAEDYINSGVEYLKKNSWVNANKIGIQGQSWGGYQVAHLITRTDMYAAAWAGAPVVNMTSAYGGIRWESGMNRQFQYEKTQSRIGATLWENPQLYIENSPLFHLPKVKTPVAIMANDADGAVPWYQGIEMFTGLKRLGKPAWLLNYNNEAHNLMQRQNRKDIQIRQQQFFDHYLKGAKAPVWMVSGIPATEKGRSWGFDLTDGQP